MPAYTALSHQSLHLTTLLHVVLLRSLLRFNSGIILNGYKIRVNTVVKCMHESHFKICCSVQLYWSFSKNLIEACFCQAGFVYFQIWSIKPSPCVTPFYFKSPCQFTLLLQRRSPIFGLSPFDPLCSITLNIYFRWEYHFWFTPLWLTLTFPGE